MGRLAARRRAVAGLALLAVAALSCAATPERGVVHVVKPGETVYRIARYYRVPAESVLRANRVRDVRDIRVGTKLWIPGTERRPPAAALPGPAPERTGPLATPRGREPALDRDGLVFGWPLRGKLTSRFGWRGRRRHEGIDLASRRGTAVRAAEAGRVIYAGNGLGAYGNVVIVRHSRRFETVYAHNRRNHVKKGSAVRKGQVIAELGSTGNATGPHLHFEIRENDRARDPLLYLP